MCTHARPREAGVPGSAQPFRSAWGAASAFAVARVSLPFTRGSCMCVCESGTCVITIIEIELRTLAYARLKGICQSVEESESARHA
eukprot:1406459-Pleurochrysis_carterae.AAC.1